MLDLTDRIAAHTEREARQADLGRRDREHGGLTPHDRAAEEKQRSTQGWGPYKPSATEQEARQARAGTLRDDIGRVPMSRLWADCAVAVRRWRRDARAHEAESLRNDALWLLVKWPSQGQNPPLDLGGKDGRPLRRDWETVAVRSDDGTRERQLTRAAWRALHAAVKQASESPARAAAIEEAELPSGDAADLANLVDIAALSEAEQRAADAITRLPDPEAPEIVAECLGCTLDMARAIVARAYPHATRRDLAETWDIGVQAVDNALARGAAAIRKRWPQAADLLSALDTVAEAYRTRTESAAILTLLRYRDGRATDTETREAVAAYRATHGEPSSELAALQSAARAAILRQLAATGAGASPDYVATLADRITASVRRIMPAEQRRGYRVAARAERGSVRPYRTLVMAEPSLSAAPTTRETRADRIWTYGLTARDDRARRV